MRGLLDALLKHTCLCGRWISFHHITCAFLGYQIFKCRAFLEELSHIGPLISSDQVTCTLSWSKFTSHTWDESYLIHLSAYTVSQNDMMNRPLLLPFPHQFHPLMVTPHCGKGIWSSQILCILIVITRSGDPYHPHQGLGSIGWPQPKRLPMPGGIDPNS